MREILFRGKDECTKEWIYGSLHKERGETNNAGDFSFWYRILGLNGQCNYVIPESVSQYTGLTDKNGKKVFEGDICEVTIFDCFDHDTQYICMVIFIDGIFCFVNENKDVYLMPTNIVDFENDIEVIGNIHDNPELLKEASK